MQISKGVFTKQTFQNRQLPSDQTYGTNLREDEPNFKSTELNPPTRVMRPYTDCG